MTRLVLFLVAVLGLVVAAVSLTAQERPETRLVFTGRNNQGEAWANVTLTTQRLGEIYVPLVVMIVNRDRESITIDRDAIRLDGTPRSISGSCSTESSILACNSARPPT